MSEYQVLARKYRPQTFAEVLGQNATVTILKNAIKQNRLAHGYLFCGSRGTGKTTLARVFAKALNCLNPTADFEPCNNCSSCSEITLGCSLDVMEIDGASHRGIDDIREINQNVGYRPTSSKYKIYIIDEVHMLTKEAFNALLKTLEEPPAQVKFFFATTEPHKVLPTILSRCQRFNLNRIATEEIVLKLQRIAKELTISIHEDAIRLIAMKADGGLRDAESLLDQIIAFNEGEISEQTVSDILGMMPKEAFFKLDTAGKEGNLAFAFELAHRVFSEGKDILHFVESLNEHIRKLLMIKLVGKHAPFLNLLESEKDAYEASSKLYSEEQCITILEFLGEAQNQIRYMTSPKYGLEALLIRIIKTHQRIAMDLLVKRLIELEKRVESTQNLSKEIAPAIFEEKKLSVTRQESEYQGNKPKIQVQKQLPPEKEQKPSLTEDPTPTAADLGIKVKKPEAEQSLKAAAPILPKSHQYDTLLQFAAVELEGTIKKQ